MIFTWNFDLDFYLSSMDKWYAHIDGSVQDYSTPIANALEILQSCSKLSIWSISDFLGADSIKGCHLTSIGNPIVEIRRSYDRLISTMGFPILLRWHLFINQGPDYLISMLFYSQIPALCSTIASMVFSFERCFLSIVKGLAYFEILRHKYISCLVQDFSNSIANALELLQSYTKPSIFFLSWT